MSSLKTGAMVLAYKQEEYIAYSLRALAPHVDHIVVMFSDRPFSAYNAEARERFTKPDRTRAILREVSADLPNVTVVEGVWGSEPAVRNAALGHLRDMGAQICLIVDADEIYPDDGLPRLLAHIEAAAAPGTVYYARYVTCFKRFDYIVQSDHRMPAAVHIREDTAFRAGTRRPSGLGRDLPDDLYFWHLGYVLSDERMWEKIHTFSHAHEIVPRWFEEKWLRWTPETRDLFRKEPRSRWRGTIRIDPRLLPEILHDHCFFPRVPTGEAVSGQLPADGGARRSGASALRRSRAGASKASRYPTFAVIGATRSGTTSFHHLLATHPEIHMSPVKGPGLFLDPGEPIFYPSKYESLAEKREHRTDEEILAMMREGYRGQRHFGESTDLYSRYPTIAADIPAKMLRTNPDIRILYLVRNPIDRILSQFQYERFKPHRPAPESFDEYVEASPDPVGISKYYLQLTRYRNAGFEREQIRVVLLEELVKDPVAAMAQVTEFLEIDDLPRWTLPHLNGSSTNGNGGPDRSISSTRYDRLLQELLPEIAGLEDWIGRKIDAWDLSEGRWCART